MKDSIPEQPKEEFSLGEARYRRVFESAKDAIVLIEDTLFVDCNARAEILLGCPRQNILGRGMTHFSAQKQPDGQDSSQKAVEIADRALLEGNLCCQWEFLRQDGKAVEAEVVITPVELNPRPLLMATICDISGRRHAEGDLARYSRDLEDLIRERTSLLEQEIEHHMKTECSLRESERLKSALLASMSHELRTPLNSIIGFTGILLQGLAGPLNPEQTKQLGFVRESSRHLLELINDVLDLSKIEADQMQFEYHSFDLRETIARVVSLMKPIAEKKGLSFQVSIDSGVRYMIGDRRRVEQVLINLLSNAVKFAHQGGVSMTCTLQGDRVCVAVTDTGIGISPQDQEHIFTPFRQLASGLTRKYEGTGLGLSISQRIVHMMHGSITVKSQEGRGSTFTVTFPATGGGT